MSKKYLAPVLILAMAIAACSDDEKSSQGGYNEACFFGGTCNSGLICVADVCKYLPDGGTDCDGAYCDAAGLAGQGPDEDGDGWGECCDCDDAVATTYPDADETCNLIDDDCDGVTDEGFDADGDGYTSCAGDCDDSSQGIHPNAAENCDGVDEDCDGETDETVEHQACPLTEGLCAGTWSVCLGVQGMSDCDYGLSYEEVEISCDSLDNDCDGLTDEDLPMLMVPETGPQALDGIDNNCNGLVDEVGGMSVPQIQPDGSTIWVDAYEVTLFQNPDCTGTRYGENVDDYPAGFEPDNPTIDLYACSIGGLVPSGHLSWYRARSACEAQGKRLCNRNEYARACIVGEPSLFPYGPMFLPGVCNDPFQEIGQAVETGSYENCTNGSTFDMSGNLAEWILDWHFESPGFAHVAGWGFSPIECIIGFNCYDLVHGPMEQACSSDGECGPADTPICYQGWCTDEVWHDIIRENLANCIASDNDPLGRDVFAVGEARPELGTRCCYDGP